MKSSKEKRRSAAHGARVALITGVTGQDGSYLSEFLLDKGYIVHGILRRSATPNTSNIAHLADNPRLILHIGDLADAECLSRIIEETRPDEVYNLAAQSHVRASFDIPVTTSDITGVGALRLLDSIRFSQERTGKRIKFYQASSSEMFGKTPPPQSERTAFHPRSSYACAKAFAYHATVNYREAYGLFAVNGILFNHESPRRGSEFVTRKIAMGVAKIKAGLASHIELGNLDARRDWGFAPEYMEAAWLIMQQPKADDFVIGTGASHSVRDFVAKTFSLVGIKDWKRHVRQKHVHLRPTEVIDLIADASKARRQLGWKPKTDLNHLVRIMLAADLLKLGQPIPWE